MDAHDMYLLDKAMRSPSESSLDEETFFERERAALAQSDSENDDDDDDDDNEAAIVADINRLQDELSHNQYQYEKHVSLINNLQKLGELELLREAREKMNKIYPMSPKLWLAWIQDENQIASTTEQMHQVLSLYDRAVEEYFDISLWLEYLNFATKVYNERKDLDKLRQIYDRSLVQAGLHVVSGAWLWKLYRTIELQFLYKLGSINDTNSEQIHEHLKKIFDLYRGQLTIPLSHNEEDYVEFDKWIEEVKEKYNVDLGTKQPDFHTIKTKYEKAKKTLEKLKTFEANFENSDSPHYEQYLKYLDAEIASGDLARTLVLFERAIAENCLQPELWLKYLQYCDEKIVVGTILFPIYERSVRNCPWVVDLWVHYLEALERLGESDDSSELSEKMCSVFNQALGNMTSVDDCKKLWFTYLHFIRRKTNRISGWSDQSEVSTLRETFQRAIKTIESMSSIEYCYDMYKYFAKVEVKFCKNQENAKKLWEQLTETPLKYQANFWIDYANFMQLFVNEDEFKRILLKGLNMCADYPESIGELLLRFEQEDADSVKQYEETLSKYRKVLNKINLKRQKEAEKNAEKSAQVEEKKKPSKVTKRKAEAEDEVASSKKDVKRKKVEKEKGGEEGESGKPAHGVTVKTDEAKRDQTVFVSNLDYAVTEDEIRQAFLQFGPVADVRLVRNYKGLSKGYCYVEFDNFDSVRKAVANDRTMLRNRPMYISEMEKRKQFSYSNAKEENKLFVKEIPFEFTKEDLLEKVFADFKDSVVDIRIITFRNGHSKGMAYVEMKDPTTAAKAVEATNNFEVGGRKLVVAISDPSKAKATLSTSQRSHSTFSSTMLLPRSLKVKTQPSKVKVQIGKTNGDAPEQTTEETQTSEAKSNDQFRSLFLKK